MLPPGYHNAPGEEARSDAWTFVAIQASVADLNGKATRHVMIAAFKCLALTTANMRDQLRSKMLSVSVTFDNSRDPTGSRCDLQILRVDVVNVDEWFVGQTERLERTRNILVANPTLLVGYSIPRDIALWAGSTFTIDMSNSILPATHVGTDVGTARALATLLRALRRKVVRRSG